MPLQGLSIFLLEYILSLLLLIRSIKMLKSYYPYITDVLNRYTYSAIFKTHDIWSHLKSRQAVNLWTSIFIFKWKWSVYITLHKHYCYCIQCLVVNVWSWRGLLVLHANEIYDIPSNNNITQISVIIFILSAFYHFLTYDKSIFQWVICTKYQNDIKFAKKVTYIESTWTICGLIHNLKHKCYDIELLIDIFVSVQPFFHLYVL